MRHIKRYTQLFESVQELSQEQRDWLDKCSKGSWNLNPKTGLVDVKGDFDCGRQGLDSFKGVRFGRISGKFDCSENRLTSLEGAPQSVGIHFDCSYNSLISLEGGPQSVGGDFYCHTNTISERTIKEVLKRMSDSGISLGQAVESYWKSIPKDDRLYLAKHHPNLSPEEKRGYESLLKFKGKVI